MVRTLKCLVYSTLAVLMLALAPASAAAAITLTTPPNGASATAGNTFASNILVGGATGAVTVTLTTAPANATLTLQPSGAWFLQWPTTLADVGSTLFTVLAKDSTGATATRSFTVYVVARPTFSIPYSAPEGSCICTPLLMNTTDPSVTVVPSHRWFVKAKGTALTATVTAVAVNSVDGATVRLIRVGGPAFTVQASYPAGTPAQTEVSASNVLATVPGQVVEFQLTTPGTSPLQAHYRLKFDGADSAATISPAAPSFEEERATWYYNVGSGETLDLQVLVDKTPSASTNVSYRLTDPNGGTTTGVASATTGSPATITGAAIAGTWALTVESDGHYRLSKQSGLDRGQYLREDSAGYGDLSIRIATQTAGGSPFPYPVSLSLLDADGNVIDGGTLVGGLDAGKIEAGTYTLQVTGVPAGWTALTPSITFTVLCDGSAEIEFVIADITPPALNVADVTIPATSASGASYVYSVTATDEADPNVDVVCQPPSGSTFAIGSTIVACTATDDAGNETNAWFTVTVTDTVAPAGACTPSVNPSTKNVPRASDQNEDGFYLVSASDNVTASPSITLGSYTLAAGETVKLTQTPGLEGVVFVGTMGTSNIRHFRVGSGDPTLKITDGAGNTTTTVCYVPPIPK